MSKLVNDNLIGFIWNIANKLRGPYRPPQYRRVMLPMIVLRRMDCVSQEKKSVILERYTQLMKKGIKGESIHRTLENEHPLYNISQYNFEKLLDDSDNIARNLISYIQGFSPKAREIFDKFNFEQEIEKLDDTNRLYSIIKEFADPKIDLHPNKVDNLQMGYIFEELVRKFNEQANEEAGDHFTPREVINLMAHLVFTKEEDVYTPNIYRTIYDPTCGTGGMLSVSEKYIREHNPNVNLDLFGQEYNPESYAICCADLLIKGEAVDNIIFGDTLGDGKTGDGHPDKKFHYMLANPPFGVEWKSQQHIVEKEHKELGFNGRFGVGTPRINDGALLFLLHMMSKMHESPENGGEGSKIAIVFNGSPLFTGDAGSGESNIRRWIIENDYLDTIVALPDQMFYNTGIFTYIWIVSNKKPAERKGKVQLIDSSHHYKKMSKSLGNKRNELGDGQNNSQNHIDEITRLYANFLHNDTSSLTIDGKEYISSKIFNNQDFGFLKVTVERPLRLNFCASAERIRTLWQETAFINLATSKKRKNEADIELDKKEGQETQEKIIKLLESIGDKLYTNRDEFEKLFDKTLKKADFKIEPSLKKSIMNVLSERDKTADICTDKKGNIEADPELRDTEIIPLPHDISLPLPLTYDVKSDNGELIVLVKEHCENYLKTEVLPHVPNAWIDYSKIKVGYEIPFNRHFYVYTPPRDLSLIEEDIKLLEDDIIKMLRGIVT